MSSLWSKIAKDQLTDGIEKRVETKSQPSALRETFELVIAAGLVTYGVMSCNNKIHSYSVPTKQEQVYKR